MKLCEQCAQTLGPDSTRCPNCGAPAIPDPMPFDFAGRQRLALWGLGAAGGSLAAWKFIGSLADSNPVTFGPIMLPVQAMILVGCAVGAALSGTKSEPASPARRAEPAPAAPVARAPKVTPLQRAAMDRFVRMNHIGMGAFLGAVAAGVCALCSACNEGRYVIPCLTALAPCALVTIVMLYGIKTFVCPGCGAEFSIPRAGSRRVGGEGSRCMSCGFDVYA
jgi:predicted RNA-binding Zn-ribbon protein involved in translation (DUF1610 family)